MFVVLVVVLSVVVCFFLVMRIFLKVLSIFLWVRGGWGIVDFLYSWDGLDFVIILFGWFINCVIMNLRGVL